jgi:hypothetical protein
MEHSVNFTMTNGEQAGRQKGLVASWGSHHTHKLTAGSALLLPYKARTLGVNENQTPSEPRMTCTQPESCSLVLRKMHVTLIEVCESRKPTQQRQGNEKQINLFRFKRHC